MKILHINFSDRNGGAAIAAYRHHEALRKAGLDSQMLVAKKLTKDPNVFQSETSTLKHLFYRGLNKALRETADFYASWSWNHFGGNLSNEIKVREADIIILHWINFNTLSIKGIEKLLQLNKPVYWFMHDMWPITGGCHHALDCTKFMTHCSQCPMFHKKQGSRKDKDLSYCQFDEKIRYLSKYPNLSAIVPSLWLRDKVTQSTLFKDRKIHLVRNILDTNSFNIQDKASSRKALNLPMDKKLVLFGAENVIDPYKGWNYLNDALNSDLEGVEVVMYGNSPEHIENHLKIKSHKLGPITDQDKLITLYNACDLFVSSSIADNYPNVIVEAIACGLPVVAFATGGIPEIIHDGENGFIAEQQSSENLKSKIKHALDYFDSDFRENIRTTILKDNSYNSVLKQYAFLPIPQNALMQD